MKACNSAAPIRFWVLNRSFFLLNSIEFPRCGCKPPKNWTTRKVGSEKQSFSHGTSSFCGGPPSSGPPLPALASQPRHLRCWSDHQLAGHGERSENPEGFSMEKPSIFRPKRTVCGKSAQRILGWVLNSIKPYETNSSRSALIPTSMGYNL